MDWDWDAHPTYESERIRIEGRFSPIIVFDMKLPRRLEDREIALMLSLVDFHLQRGRPFVAVVRHVRGTGVIIGRHRKAFADWLEARREQLQSDDFVVVVSVPEPIFRAVLRVVYRFRVPPLRTVTTPDLRGAVAAAREELQRMGRGITPEIDRFLDSLTD